MFSDNWSFIFTSIPSNAFARYNSSGNRKLNDAGSLGSLNIFSSLDTLMKKFNGFDPQLFLKRMDSCNGGFHHFTDWDIVEPHNGDIPRYMDPACIEGPDGSRGNYNIFCKQCVGQILCGVQPAANILIRFICRNVHMDDFQ